MMTDHWDAKNYTQFLDARTRPARDLLAVIPDSFQPEYIYDLGCGPGNSTILLKNRWPKAKIVGIDASSNMLHAARQFYPDIAFVQGDIAQFSPAGKIDCLFANASLQWLNDHETLFPKLFRLLNVGGILALQMPNNFHAPSHQITIKLLQNYPNGQSLLKKLCYGPLSRPMYNPTWYYDLLIKAGAKSIQLWETEYFQEMPDYQSIFNWLKGTGLSPVLAAMDISHQKQFADAYLNAVSKEYLQQKNTKILLPFRRFFIVANHP